MGNMPVARASRLPTWPALSTPSVRRTRCKAAFDDNPTGLSSSRIPLRGPVAVIARTVGAIARHRLVDQTRQVSGLVGRIVNDELQARGVPQAQTPSHLPAQES